MRVITLPCGPIDANCYIVWDENQSRDESGLKVCAVIDPADAKLIMQRMAAEKLHCTHILLTHGHFDHIAGLAELKAATGARVCVNEGDLKMLLDGRYSYANGMGARQTPTQPDLLVNEGDTIEVGGLKLRVLYTPGHSKGGVTYVVDGERAAFTGDTVFFESIGRTDLLGGSMRELSRSFFDKILTLPPETKLYPGHMIATSVAHESEYNLLIGDRSNA